MSILSAAVLVSTKARSGCAQNLAVCALTSLTVPSQEDEMKRSFLIFDQSTEKTSRVCSCHARIGRS